MKVATETFFLTDYADDTGEFVPSKYIDAVQKVLDAGWKPLAVQYCHEETCYIWHFTKD